MPKYVFHYTSLDALLGILKKDKSNVYLNFWGSRYDCMNDPQDYLFASKIVLPKLIKSIESREDINKDIKEDIEIFPYIVSFSENEDDESMWKYYRAEVCLKIDTQYLSPWIHDNDKITGFWGKCCYVKEDEIDEKFFETWNNSLHHIDNILSMARHACVFIKRYAFKRENEWRLYMADETLGHVREDGIFYRTEQPLEIKCKGVKDGDIILYKEFHVDAKALSAIIVNDTNLDHFHKVKKHVELLLLSRGFYPEDISIEQTIRYPLS